MLVISFRILQNNFIQVALSKAEELIQEKQLDKKEVSDRLNNCENIDEFKKVYDSYFSDEILLDVKQ